MSNVWHRTCIALYVSVHVSVCFIFQICTMACRGGMFIAGIFTVAGLGLLIAAVATVHWVDTLVDRTALAALNDAAITADLQNNPIYFTRYRGMFTTCYETDNSRSVSPCILKRSATWKLPLSHLPPWQNVRLFADDIFRCIFVNENICILIEISLKFVPKGPIDNNQALV